jgi:G3E family GTPase
MDDEMKDKLRLDAIITLVDAKHLLQHMDSDECQAQLAFADIVLLNKRDLVSEAELAAVEQQVRDLNKLARIHPTVQGELPLDELLGVGAFDLETRAAEMPEFLQEELPFEWAGLYDLEPGVYELALKPGPDPTIDLVLGGPGLDDKAIFDAWKRESIVLYSSDPLLMQADRSIAASEILYRLPVDWEAGATTSLTIEQAGRYVLFTQHLPEEFDMTLRRDGEPVEPIEAYEYASPHEHDDTVGSVGVRLAGDLDPDRFEAWMINLLRNRGTDIFRTKGVLSLAGDAKRFVFQGVHMLFDGQPGRDWEADAERESQLVFIGRDLDRTELTEGLRTCLA